LIAASVSSAVGSFNRPGSVTVRIFGPFQHLLRVLWNSWPTACEREGFDVLSYHTKRPRQ
jgi:hypothetical protein